MTDLSPENLVLPPPPPRKGGGMKTAFFLLMFLGLLGVIVYLLSVLNAKRFYLVAEGSELVVKQGLFLPMGNERYLPPDLEKANLYRPIQLPDGFPPGTEKVFDGLSALNREWAVYLMRLTTSLVFSEDEAKYLQGKEYLERLGSLEGLDARQMHAFQQLFADVQYIEAKRSYLGVEKTLEEALRKFRHAETFGTDRFRDADQWARRIQTLLDSIQKAKSSSPGQDRASSLEIVAAPAPAEEALPAPRPAEKAKPTPAEKKPAPRPAPKPVESSPPPAKEKEPTEEPAPAPPPVPPPEPEEHT